MKRKTPMHTQIAASRSLPNSVVPDQTKIMERRKFLRKATLAGVVGAAIGNPSALRASPSRDSEDIHNTGGGNSSSTGSGPTVRVLAEDRTVMIPRDYKNLQDAFDGESHWLPRGNREIKVLIEKGHAISSGLIIKGGNFGHFRIVSEDGVVEVADDFRGDLVAVFRGVGPVLATMFNMRGKGANGIYCCNAFMTIEDMDVAGKICGIRNARRDGAIAAEGSGIKIGRRDSADRPPIPRHAEVSGSGRHNLHAANGGKISARHGIFTGAGVTNVCATHAALVSCDRADLSHAKNLAIRCSAGSSVDARGARIFNSVQPVHVDSQGRVALTNAVIADAQGTGVLVIHASAVSLNNAVIRNCRGNGLDVRQGSTASADGATIRDNAPGNDLVVRQGGTISATGTETTRGKPSVLDTSVSEFNTVTERGVIHVD